MMTGRNVESVEKVLICQEVRVWSETKQQLRRVVSSMNWRSSQNLSLTLMSAPCSVRVRRFPLLFRYFIACVCSITVSWRRRFTFIYRRFNQPVFVTSYCADVPQPRLTTSKCRLTKCLERFTNVDMTTRSVKAPGTVATVVLDPLGEILAPISRSSLRLRFDLRRAPDLAFDPISSQNAKLFRRLLAMLLTATGGAALRKCLPWWKVFTTF